MRDSKNFKNGLRWENYGLFYLIKSSKSSTTQTLQPWVKIFIRLLIVFTFILLLSLNNFKINSNGWVIFKSNLNKIFSFSNTSDFLNIQTNLWILSFKYLWKTIKLTLVGTFIGFIFAIFTSLISEEKFFKTFYIFKILFLFLRSIPEVSFILLFTNIFDAYVAVLLVYIWFSWLWLHKYYVDILKNINYQYYFLLIQQGKSKFLSLKKAIWPQLYSKYISLFLYSFESNLRWGSILSTVGLFGIGSLINYAGKNFASFNQITIPLFLLFTSVIILEILFLTINKFLLQDQNIAFKNKKLFQLQNYFEWKKWIKIVIFVSLISFSIYILANLKLGININYLKYFLKGFKSFDWIVFNNTQKLLFIESLPFAILTVFITTFLSILYLPLTLRFLWGNKIIYLFRGLNSLIRVLPTIFMFYIFNPIFESSYTLVFLLVAFHQSCGFNKRLIEQMNKIDDLFVRNLKLKGYSDWDIYWKFLLPSVKNEIITLVLFYFEKQIRNSITYGFLVSDGLNVGKNLSNFLNIKNNQYVQAISLMTSITIFFFITNIVLNLANIFMTKNYKLRFVKFPHFPIKKLKT